MKKFGFVSIVKTFGVFAVLAFLASSCDLDTTTEPATDYCDMNRKIKSGDGEISESNPRYVLKTDAGADKTCRIEIVAQVYWMDDYINTRLNELYSELDGDLPIAFTMPVEYEFATPSHYFAVSPEWSQISEGGNNYVTMKLQINETPDYIEAQNPIYIETIFDYDADELQRLREYLDFDFLNSERVKTYDLKIITSIEYRIYEPQES